MDVESRDSVSLKPAELDELGQLVHTVGLPVADEQLDQHVEHFPLIILSNEDDVLTGFLFGSLERIGGTPCILWGLGAVKKGRNARTTLEELVGELRHESADASREIRRRNVGSRVEEPDRIRRAVARERDEPEQREREERNTDELTDATRE